LCLEEVGIYRPFFIPVNLVWNQNGGLLNAGRNYKK
jgi:hypothetical protein